MGKKNTLNFLKCCYNVNNLGGLGDPYPYHKLPQIFSLGFNHLKKMGGLAEKKNQKSIQKWRSNMPDTWFSDILGMASQLGIYHTHKYFRG